jgi:hypothetical protein
MFFSKTWFLLVTVAGGLAVALALLAPRPVQRDLERETGARLERAAHSASLLLKNNARKWIDSAAQVCTDAVLIEALEQATKGPADLGLVHKTVQERLRYFNEQLKVDLMMATDARGRVIARAGLDENVYRDGVEGFPLVADALRGYRGDDTWSLGGKLYRVAASPVIARDRYAGALIVGQEVAGELAASMKRVIEVDVVFLLRGRVLAATAQLPLLAQLPVLVDSHIDELQQNGHSVPITVDEGDQSYLVVLAPVTGEAAAHKAAYALVVPRAPTASLLYLATQLLQTDPKTLPWKALAPVAAGLVLTLLIGFLFFRLEAARPLARLAREAQALARGEVSRLDDDHHPGKFGTVARALNTTLDRIGATARPGARFDAAPPFAGRPEPAGPFAPSPSPRPEALNSITPLPPPRLELLPPTRAEVAAARTFEAPRPEPPRNFEPRPPDVPPPPPLPKRPSGQRAMVAPEASMEFESRPTEQRQRPTPEELGLFAPPKIAAARPPQPDSRLSPIEDPGPDFVESPSEVLTPIAQKIPTPRSGQVPTIGSAGPSMPKDVFDDQTAVGSPSEALLRQARDKSKVGVSPLGEEALEAEFRQVYRDFLETKQACGESVEGITFDKFSGKLRSNRQQLISRYSCKTVKFQVYVKDGKAALKATPVTA